MNTEIFPAEFADLKVQLAAVPGILLINKTLARQAVYNLEALCDRFVSLHRSEGFGLGLAECMYLGKPVIGTHWSGNVDFMNHKNSCPVDYTLVPLAKDSGPYQRGQIWAEAGEKDRRGGAAHDPDEFFSRGGWAIVPEKAGAHC
jgi:glycosyltransferase involved in cell wall biosynthesis